MMGPGKCADPGNAPDESRYGVKRQTLLPATPERAHKGVEFAGEGPVYAKYDKEFVQVPR